MRRYRILIFWIPIYRDLNEGKWYFSLPHFGLTTFKDRPCPTNWLYDWILNLGYISIYRNSDYAMTRKEV